MEVLKNQVLFSRPGRTTVHMYPNLYFGPSKARRPEKELTEPPGDIRTLVRSEQTRLEEFVPLKVSSPSSSFKAVSRDKYQFTFRNKSDSPSVSRYTPKTEIISPRVTKTPAFKTVKTFRKQGRVFLPKCIDKDLNCRYSDKNHDAPPGVFDKQLHRQVSSRGGFDTLIAKKESELIPIPEKVSPRVINVRDFKRVKSREPFVDERGPPSPKRFDFNYPISYAISTNRKPSVLKFDQLSERNYPFKLGLSIGSYDRNEEKTLPRLGRLVLNFGKMKGRTSQVLDHILENPQSPALEKLEKAFNRQSQVKGTTNIPLLKTLSPRDDKMYRTNEGYSMNVPERQDASSTPRFISNSERLSTFAMAKAGASVYNF